MAKSKVTPTISQPQYRVLRECTNALCEISRLTRYNQDRGEPGYNGHLLELVADRLSYTMEQIESSFPSDASDEIH